MAFITGKDLLWPAQQHTQKANRSRWCVWEGKGRADVSLKIWNALQFL